MTQFDKNVNKPQNDTVYPNGATSDPMYWNESEEPPEKTGWYVVMKRNKASPSCLRRYANRTGSWHDVVRWMGPIPTHGDFYFTKGMK